MSRLSRRVSTVISWAVVERAGLSWQEALSHLNGEGWREELEDNRRALLQCGLWGVPSFRLLGEAGEPDFCTWGQDRIWRIEEEIRRRLVPETAGGLGVDGNGR